MFGNYTLVAGMSAAPGYELYRVILDYEALQDGFLDRIDDLDTTLEQIDMAGEFTKGNVQKLLTKSPPKRGTDRHAKQRRTFAWESLGKMLKGTGLALVLVVDDERFAPLKEQLAKRARPRKPANAGSKRPAWLFRKDKAREMGKRRFALMSEAEKKRHQRRAGKASGRARRKSRALVQQPAPQFDIARTSGAINAQATRGTPSADQVPRNPC